MSLIHLCHFINSYGIEPIEGKPTSDSQVLCTSFHSKLNPLEDGEVFNLVFHMNSRQTTINCWCIRRNSHRSIRHWSTVGPGLRCRRWNCSTSHWPVTFEFVCKRYELWTPIWWACPAVLLLPLLLLLRFVIRRIRRRSNNYRREIPNRIDHFIDVSSIPSKTSASADSAAVSAMQPPVPTTRRSTWDDSKSIDGSFHGN